MAGRTFVVNSETMGRGDDDLGRTLMGSFFRTLVTGGRLPDVVVFYNTGVRLLVPGSVASEALGRLAEAGVDLLACGTCVARFDLDRATLVGRVSNMQEIAALMMDSEIVVTL
jgi:hypothetical protein